jgi:hypothetical protein
MPVTASMICATISNPTLVVSAAAPGTPTSVACRVYCR